MAKPFRRLKLEVAWFPRPENLTVLGVKNGVDVGFGLVLDLADEVGLGISPLASGGSVHTPHRHYSLSVASRYWVVGESLVLPPQSRLKSLAKNFLEGGNDARELGDDILQVVLIFPHKRQAIIASNISSCRWSFYSVQDGSLYCSTSIRHLEHFGVTLRANEQVIPEFLLPFYIL